MSSSIPPKMHGQFSWYDLMTPDASTAKKFYPSVTNWGTEEWDKSDYTMWTANGVAMGGINPITPEQAAQGVHPHWLAYVTVDDVEAATNKARSLGGKVMHGPETIPDVGRFAIIQDPQGAMVAIIKSVTPSPGFDGTRSLGRFSWHELMTTDYNRAFDFYRQLFGWEKMGELDMGAGGGGKYLEYGKNGKMYGGMFNRRPEHGQMPPNWTYYVNVKDVGKAIAAAKKGGGGVMIPPMEVPGGDIVAVLSDNLGATFAVHQTKAKASGAAAAKTAPKRSAKVKKKAKAKARPKAKPKARAKAKKAVKAKARPKARPKAKRAAKKKKSRRR